MLDALLVAGMCHVTFNVNAEAQSQYGVEIVDALGILSEEMGVQFTQVPGPADLTYVTEALADPLYGLAYPEEGRTELSSNLPVYEGQTARQIHRLKVKVILHETLHNFGFDHDDDWFSIMHPIVDDTAVTFTELNLRMFKEWGCK